MPTDPTIEQSSIVPQLKEATSLLKVLRTGGVRAILPNASRTSGPYPGCHSPEHCNAAGRCQRDPVCFN